MTHPALIERITRSLAYMLRHQPEEFDLEVDQHGFAEMEDVVRALNERLGESVDEDDVRDAVTAGDRQRYEIEGSRIRALYGHSIDVLPGEPSKPPQDLFVGISRTDAERAQRYGLRAGRRRFLHLALTPEDAIESGRRAARDYAIIVVHAVDAWEEGINFYDRKSLFLSDPIPTDFLDVGEVRSDGFGDEEGGGERRGDDRGRDRHRGGGGGGGRGRQHDRPARQFGGDAEKRGFTPQAPAFAEHPSAVGGGDEYAQEDMAPAGDAFGAGGDVEGGHAPMQHEGAGSQGRGRRRRGRRGGGGGFGRGAGEPGAPSYGDRPQGGPSYGTPAHSAPSYGTPPPGSSSSPSYGDRPHGSYGDRPAPREGGFEPRGERAGGGERGRGAPRGELGGRGPREGGFREGGSRESGPREDGPRRDAPREHREPQRFEPGSGPRRGPDDRGRFDAPRHEGRRDEPRRDEARRDETRRDETRRDETRRDEARRDEPRRDEPRREGWRDTAPSQHERPRHEDRPRHGGPRGEASRHDAPRGAERPFREDRPRDDRGREPERAHRGGDEGGGFGGGLSDAERAQAPARRVAPPPRETREAPPPPQQPDRSVPPRRESDGAGFGAGV
jgi:putative RNA 2'-phosphotransferase